MRTQTKDIVNPASHGACFRAVSVPILSARNTCRASAAFGEKLLHTPEESICQYAAENVRLLGGVPQRQPFCTPTTESMLPALWADSESLCNMTLQCLYHMP